MEKLNLKQLKNQIFHFIGIGGISMSALALMLKKDGFCVQGSDETENDEVKKLIKKKVTVFVGHAESNVVGAGVVVVSSAIHYDNPEYQYALKNNLTIIKRAELLGCIASMYKTTIAIAGSHGKTTTTAMISEMFILANKKPTIHVGGVLKLIDSNYMIGNKKYFITENCEYKDNFLQVKPDISVILNIDSDHLDYFGSLENLKKSFFKYASITKNGGINIVSGDDKNTRFLLKNKDNATFGLSKKCDIFAENIREYKKGFYSFDVIVFNCNMGNIKLNIVGKHNIYNALACVFVGLVCQIDFETIVYAIENFSGVKRRCEIVGELNGAMVFHDYAHHPKQIEKMISVALSQIDKKQGKVIVVFEPHTFSRTKYLLEDFAKSFKGSDLVIFAPVYSARENESDGANSKDLALKTKKYAKNCLCLNSYEEIKKVLKHVVMKGDIVMILGAGTIEKLPKMICDRI